MNLAKTIRIAFALALLVTGRISCGEEERSIMTALSSTTLSGYVNTSASWWFGPQNVIPNDPVNSALAVETNRVPIPPNLTESTLEWAEPPQPHQTGSIWYKWRAAQAGVARISVTTNAPVSEVGAASTVPALSEESIFNSGGGFVLTGVSSRTTIDGITVIGGYSKWWTSLAVYRIVEISPTEGRLELVQRSSRLQFDVQAGETYWVAVEVYQGFPAYEGQQEEPYVLPTDLYFDLTPTPANDSFSSSLSIAESSRGYMRGYTLGATREAGEPDLGGAFSAASVWFHYTAATFGRITIGSNENRAAFAVFTGDDLATLKLVAKADYGLLNFFGEGGKVYHIAVYHAERTELGYSIQIEAPKYRLYETTLDALFPGDLTPHFYGVRGATMLLYAKSATGWDLVEVERIFNESADLLIRPSDAIDGQLRVVTIDEWAPSPHVEIRNGGGSLSATLVGIPGQTCAVSYSTDLSNWSDAEVLTLGSAETFLRAIEGTSNYFFRVTESAPLPPASMNPIGVHQQTGGPRDVPPPPVPSL